MSATGVLDVITSDERVRYEWNGNVEDRAKAKAAFEDAIESGYFLAVAFDAPGKGKQVRSFKDVEEIERERGTVAAQVSTALVGG